MRRPDQSALATLLTWAPRRGVVSVYLDVDPADRGEGWRTELRNGLHRIQEAARDGERETRMALKATAERILGRFPAEATHPEGRTQIGFVEVGDGGREEWFSAQLPLSATEIVHDARPFVRPLVVMLDDGATRGVIAVSSERVRVLEWSLGAIEELESWGLEIFSGDWRERKSRRSPDPGRVQGVNSSGRDQFDQRLEANRQRFLHEAGGLVAAEARRRGWGEVLVVGEAEQARELGEGAGPGIETHVLDEHNVISVAPSEIGERIAAAIERRNREREAQLLDRVRDEALGGSRGALGIQETVEALQQGRVEHLLFDAERDYAGAPIALPGGDESEVPLAERMIEMAVATSAKVTPLEGEVARRLDDSDGVAALLRY